MSPGILSFTFFWSAWKAHCTDACSYTACTVSQVGMCLPKSILGAGPRAYRSYPLGFRIVCDIQHWPGHTPLIPSFSFRCGKWHLHASCWTAQRHEKGSRLLSPHVLLKQRVITSVGSLTFYPSPPQLAWLIESLLLISLLDWWNTLLHVCQ